MIHFKVFHISDRVFLIMLLGFVCIWMSLLGLQGFGMQDEGWVLTSYQQVFKAPESVGYNFLYYNGVLVGGIWNSLFGEFGIYAFRILNAICYTLIAWLIWMILHKIVNRWAIFVGILVTLLCTTWIGSFSHNTLSTLFILLSIFFIMKALENNNKWWMLLAGMVVGINIFSRIPNITQVALILVLIPYYARTKDYKATLQLLLFALIGFFVGVSIEFVLMLSLGHINIFLNSITSGFAAAGDTDSTHNLFSMGKMYCRQLIQSIPYGAICLIVPFFLRKKKPNWMWIISLVLLAMIAFYFRYEKNMWLLGMCTLLLLPFLIEINEKFTYISTLALIMALLFPIGSDWGYESGILINSMCLSVPLVLGIYDKYEQDGASWILRSILAIFFVIGIQGVVDIYNKTGEEQGKRIEMTCRIDTSLASVYTNKNVALQMNELLGELSNYVRPNDELLCFQSLAMVHFLTQTRPYLGNAWPWTYTSMDMAKHFEEAQSKSAKLPVVVREKSWVLDTWSPYENWDNSDADENRFHKNKKIELIQTFIKENNYVVVWENTLFQILATDKDGLECGII